MGADINIDYKSNYQDIDNCFSVGTLDKNTYSSYKQRSPLQAQYDKIGKFDTKLKDYIITHGEGIERTTSHILTFQPDSGKFTDVFWNAPKQTLIIPNSNYCFDHYIVAETLNVSGLSNKINKKSKSKRGCLNWFSLGCRPKRNTIQANDGFNQ